jgi:cytochrome c-type biogenesis protein CcmH
MTALSNLSIFILLAGLLLLAVLALLLPPLLRQARPVSAADRREANLAIFRDQLKELEHDRDEDALAAADFEQAKAELQRRLLGEIQDEAPPPARRGGRTTALALLVALPLAAVAGYLILGNPPALDPLNTQSRMSQQQIDSMLGSLVSKLKANPDDAKGWILLARSYKSLGRFPEAAEAYSHGGAVLEADPVLLADYAEVLVQISGGRFAGQPESLIKRALALDANEPQALFLAGAAASERKDFAAVADFWGKLLRQLEPGSEEALALAAAVDKAKAIAPRPSSPGGQKAAPSAARAEAISGEVRLAAAVAAQARPDDLVFVFARTDEGSRMPLAVIRTRVAELPLKFSLDDTLALPGGQALSAFRTVTLEARVAKAGKAQSASGDLFGTRRQVRTGSKNVSLLIDQIQP